VAVGECALVEQRPRAGVTDFGSAGCVVRNVVPRVRPPVYCVKPGSLEGPYHVQLQLHAKVSRNNHPQKPGSAAFGPKVTLATRFRGFLPYIFAGLLPPPQVGPTWHPFGGPRDRVHRGIRVIRGCGLS
jgi:hypothetical protein